MLNRVLRYVLAVIVIVLILPTNVGAVTISLVPDNVVVGPGGQFNVDLVLNNPLHEGLAGIGVWLKYDKNLLNVIDTDSGNWITSGTNISDGPYHSAFNLPGDSGIFDDANDANTDGEIKWDARRSFFDITDIYPSGTFARITFQAEGNLGSTSLSFAGTGTGGYPDTYVVNAAGGQILTGTNDATISVIPEPGTLLLLIGGLPGIAVFIKKDRKPS